MEGTNKGEIPAQCFHCVEETSVMSPFLGQRLKRLRVMWPLLMFLCVFQGRAVADLDEPLQIEEDSHWQTDPTWVHLILLPGILFCVCFYLWLFHFMGGKTQALKRNLNRYISLSLEKQKYLYDFFLQLIQCIYSIHSMMRNWSGRFIY